MAQYATPLVGRQPEISLLDGALDRLDGGEPDVVALLGEAGIGKSRLLAELAGRARERGCLVLAGRAAEFELDLPFGPFVDAIDDYVSALGPAETAALVGERAADLAPVLPSLGSLADAAPAAALERFRAHRAMRALLERLAERAPVVLAIDDAHWADPASIELIAHLLRRRLDGPVLLAVAYRDRQAPPELAGLFDSAAREGLARRAPLAPLSVEEAGELLGRDVPREVRERLHRDSGGNPFYLEELQRLGERAAGGDLPDAVATALELELKRLDQDARTLLGAAAVAGDPFEADLAAVIADLDERPALAALDELVAADVVRTTEFPRRFRFRHPIIRRAVYESLGAGARLAAHARAAAALEAGGASLAARAHHVERSARRGDADAVGVLTAAATAASSHAPLTAARWLGRALELLPADGTPPEQRLGLLLPRAMALVSGGRLDEGREALLEALDLLPEDAPMHQLVVSACAAAELMVGRHEQAFSRLRAAHERAAEGRPAVELEIQLAACRLYAGDFPAMTEWIRAAHARAAELDDPVVLTAAAAMRALAESQNGEATEAEAAMDQAAELMDGLDEGQLAGRLDAAYYLGYAEHFRERYEDAIRHVERGIALSRATGQAFMLVPMLLCRVFALGSLGRLAEAAAAADETIESARLSGNPQWHAWALLIRAWVAALAGELDTALSSGKQGYEKALSAEARVLAAGAAWAYANALIEAGEPERCREILLSVTDGPALEPVEVGYRCACFEMLTRAEIELGRPEAARDWVERAEEQASRLELPGAKAAALTARARLLLAEAHAAGGSGWAAATAAERAAEAADSVALAVVAARARALAGSARAEAGDRDAAVALLERAESDLAACGAERLRREAARELRRLGRRVATRATGGGDGLAALSARQRELAELVASGKTNKEIAAELVLSEKTVEGHLAQIFAKLGVRSRSAVAAAVAAERA